MLANRVKSLTQEYMDNGARLGWTRKNLLRATAVPASFVHEIMNDSRSKRQVVILDCCFSGAFAEGLLAKDDGAVDVQTQLGGEGRVVLTSSTSLIKRFIGAGFPINVASIRQFY